MNDWNPNRVFDTHLDLQLSKEEIYDINKKLKDDIVGNDYGLADAVFAGGGVRGIAFLGALKCFDQVGIKFRKVGGTSAGAITAALVAAEIPTDDLATIVGGLDFTKLLSKKTDWRIFNFSPDNDLKGWNLLWTFLNLSIIGRSGQYSSEPLKDWLEGKLKLYKMETFESFLKLQEDEKWFNQRDLKIVVSDISHQEMRVLPKDLCKYDCDPKSFLVAEAVRLSMSIPFFFEAGSLGTEDSSCIVDGGVLSNFPLWIFDTKSGERPNCPTFGFQLKEKPKESLEAAAKAEKPLAILQSMFNTMHVAHDKHYVEEHQSRLIEIVTDADLTTKFGLTDSDKNELYRAGYTAAKEFLKTWSWRSHLERRGFSPDDNQKTIKSKELVNA